MFRFCHGTVTRVNLTVLARRDKPTMSAQHIRSSAEDASSGDNRSIHSDSIEEVHHVPMHVIIRPIPPVLDEQKVQSLMSTIKVI